MNEQIAPTEPNPEHIIARMITLIQESALNGHSIMMCVGRERNGEHSFETARMNLENYADAIAMVGRLLHMVTTGTGVSLDKALSHLKLTHEDFDRAFKESE